MWRDARRPTDVILGIETSCDETAAAVVTARRRDPLERRRLAGRAARALRRRRARGRVAPPPRAVAPVIERGARRRGVELDDVDAVAVTARPGLIGALLVGVSAAKALAWARRLPLDPGQPPARARRVALPAAARPRAAVHLPARERRAHDAARRAASAARYRVLGTTLDDAAGEAFDKGARLLGLGYPGGARDRRARARRAIPTAYDFPVARVPGLDFSFSGLKTALLYRVRGLRRRRARGAARRPRRELPAGDRARARRARSRPPGAERIAVVGGVAANSELRAALPERGARAAAALHRQRRDDRLRGPLHRTPSRTRSTFRSMRVPRRSAARFSSSRSRRGRARRDRRRPAAATARVALVGRSAGAASSASRARPCRPGSASIVVLHTPSVAQRLAKARYATEAQERAWTAQALRGAAAGADDARGARASPFAPTTATTRVLDGFSAALDPRAVALLEQMPEVAGVYPVRAAFPASVSESLLATRSVRRRRAATAPTSALPGLRRPRRHDRAARHRRRRSASVPARHGPAGHRPRRPRRRRDRPPNPQDPSQLERHGTELAGHPRRRGRPRRPARRRAGRDGAADPRRRLAAGRRRPAARLRAAATS